MSQEQYRQFDNRLKRIDRIHRKGGGFEAEGTLGQSYYTRAARKARRPVVAPALAIVAAIIVLKALAAASMPAGDYDAQVSALSQGNLIDRAGAFVMAPDPISRTIGGWLAPLFAHTS